MNGQCKQRNGKFKKETKNARHKRNVIQMNGHKWEKNLWDGKCINRILENQKVKRTKTEKKKEQSKNFETTTKYLTSIIQLLEEKKKQKKYLK